MFCLKAMGIRFLCQHCHRPLNVKSVQAGLKGVCPNCSQLIVVPFESAIDLPKSSDEQIPATSGLSAAGSIIDIDKQITESGLTPSMHLSTDTTDGGVVVPETFSNRGLEALSSSIAETESLFLLDKPQPPTTMGKIDPIEEAPRNVWYYRCKELGEKGPLKAKTMQEELDNGNVTIGCIVWRDDWEDWQAAERVFPSLVALLAAERAKLSPAGQPGTDDWNSHSERRIGGRKLQWFGLAAIAIGLLIVAALAWFLSYVLSN